MLAFLPRAARRLTLALALGLAAAATLFGQANDNCVNAAFLSVNRECRENTIYSTVGNTRSAVASACEPDNDSPDQWFRFRASRPEINIRVSSEGDRTLFAPRIELYSGDCDALTPIGCAQNPTGRSPIVSLSTTDLTVGEIYFMRVFSADQAGASGSYGICVRVAEPGPTNADCSEAIVLCGPELPNVEVAGLNGAGTQRDEVEDDSCLGGVETNSAWYRFTAATDGDLTFTITSALPEGDVDFIVYDFGPGGGGGCDPTQRTIVRCNAAGGVSADGGTDCRGQTGLRAGETDEVESFNCDNGNNAFLAPLDVVAGREYALFINEFDALDSGFEIVFGGSATFEGPDAGFTWERIGGGCEDATYRFTADAEDLDYTWVFPASADVRTAGTRVVEVTFTDGGSQDVRLAVQGPECAGQNTQTVDVALDTDFEITNAGQTPITCADPDGGGVRLEVDGDGDFVFNARIGAGDVFATNTDGVFTGLPGGAITFTVYPVGDPDCEREFEVVIEDRRDIGVDVDFDFERVGGTCATADYQFDAANVPGGTFAWDFGPNADPQTAVGQQADATFTGAGPQVVILTVTLGDCSDSERKTVDVTTELSVEIVDEKAVTCEDPENGGFTVVVTPPGNYRYTVRDAVTNVAKFSTDGVFTDLPPGPKLVRVEDIDDAACFFEETVTVRDDSPLRGFEVDTVLTRPTDCSTAASGGVILSAAPDGEYTFTLNGVSNETGVFNAVPAGRNVATVEPKGISGCSQPFEFDVRDGTFEPEVAIAFEPLQDCVRGRFRFSLASEVPRGASVRWNFGDSAEPNGATEPGPHEVTFSGDAGGRIVGAVVGVGEACLGGTTVRVEYFPEAPLVEPTVTEVSCGEEDSGAIEVAVTPEGNYAFALDGGQEQATGSFDGLAVGQYAVTVRRLDLDEACAQTIPVAVTEDFSQAPKFGGVEVGAASCLAVANGTVAFGDLPAGTTVALVDDDMTAGPRFDNLRANAYRFRLTGPDGCTRDTSVVVAALPGPALDLGPDRTVTLGEAITILPAFTPGRAGVDQDSIRYIGLDSTPTQLLSLGAITFAPNRVPGQAVSVVVTDEDGCVASDEVALEVRVDQLYEVPTAFTPNGDDVNDVWYLRGGPSVALINYARVYSRWGELVFNVGNAEPNDITAGWRGTINGSPADAGVYVWVTEIAFVGGATRTFSGELNLIR